MRKFESIGDPPTRITLIIMPAPDQSRGQAPAGIQVTDSVRHTVGKRYPG
jgi:hypothetical protein